MSRITKQIAGVVANALCESRKSELKQLQSDQIQFLSTIYEASIPTVVKDAFKKYKGFLNSSTSIRVQGEGISDGYAFYQLTSQMPICNSCDRFKLDSNQAAVFVDFLNKIHDKKKEVSLLKTEIEAALFNLRTYNNVKKEFPEAFKLLPASRINTGLMVNIKDIRCKLDIANCA